MRSSRWVDYDTHELLEMISELEDERRWSRLREGFWLALLVHILFFSPFPGFRPTSSKCPVFDPFDVIKKRKDLTYLDTPPDACAKPAQGHAQALPQQAADRQKDAGGDESQSPPPPPPAQQAPEQPKPQPSQPLPPNPQSQVEAPRPAAVPAKPNFAMGSQNPADQLREDMQNAMHGHGQQNYGNLPSGGLSMHPGAGTGGVRHPVRHAGRGLQQLAARWHYITQMTWDPLIPDEVNPPILKSGVVAVRFKVLPNGQVVDMQLDGRSGDTGLDRAAWGAIIGSSYPALPREFHGPYLELRAYFLYNMEPR